MKKTVFFVVLAMVLIGSCAAQSSNDAQRIVGTWVTENTTPVSTVVFNANGTGTWDGENFFYGISSGGGISISRYGLSSETLYMSPDGKRMIISGYRFQKK